MNPEITDAQVKCRTYGHGWDEFTPQNKGGLRRMVGGFQLHLRCVRCGTMRHDVFNLVGGLAARYYEYPEGYQQAKGTEKLSRQDYRVVLMQTRRAPRRARRRAG